MKHLKYILTGLLVLSLVVGFIISLGTWPILCVIIPVSMFLGLVSYHIGESIWDGHESLNDQKVTLRPAPPKADAKSR